MKREPRFPFLEFFAGAGLAAQGLKDNFYTVWANDIDEKKAATYIANHGEEHFHLGSVSDVDGSMLPNAILSWASFPCQDLSLAGNMEGINAQRSGLVWDWIRIIKESPCRPPVLVAENVMGLVSAENGEHYRQLHRALSNLGYRVGAVLLDGIRWVPQSRPRVFVIAVSSEVEVPNDLMWFGPTWAHPRHVSRASSGLHDFVWWNMPEPVQSRPDLIDIVEFDAPPDPSEKVSKTLALIPGRHMAEFLKLAKSRDRFVAAGYKRTRQGRQCLELRFDGVGGCLRTPKGGSSRQTLVISKKGMVYSRLMTARETARMMGVPDSFMLPGSYNDGYKAMGDAVVVPVVAYLCKYLLTPICKAASRSPVASKK